MLVAAPWYFEYILARISDITLADAPNREMYNRPEPTNPVSSDYGLSNRWLTRVCVSKSRKYLEYVHSSRAYLYIDTWSWSSSVARSVILIPFKLTARETRCSFFPLAFAYWRKKKICYRDFFFFFFFWLKWREKTTVVIIVWNIRLKRHVNTKMFEIFNGGTISICTRHLEF